MGQVVKLFDRDNYVTVIVGKQKKTINLSEINRIHQAVWMQLRPGMTEKDLDRIIRDTVARMRPN